MRKIFPERERNGKVNKDIHKFCKIKQKVDLLSSISKDKVT